MKLMNKLLVTLLPTITLLIVSILVSFAVNASTSNIKLLSPGNDIQDKVSLRNGAQIYMDHCAACHAARFMRFERIGQDLDIPKKDLLEKLMRFGPSKTSQAIAALIGPDVGEALFGVAPPDLSLEARYRGPKWLYTYLMSFYKDESTTFGYNNKLMHNVAMPWVLATMQQSLSYEAFAREMRDLTNYMVYMAEPIKPFRESFGHWVLLFLAVLMVPVYLLKKEYWKDIH